MTQRVIRVGAKATKRFRIKQEDVVAFGDLIEDHNPIHSDEAAAKAAGFPGTICYGAFAGSLFSGLMAAELPGPHSVYLSQNVTFKAPIFVGEEIDVNMEVTQFRKEKGIVGIKTTITKEDPEKGKVLCVDGYAVAMNKLVTFEGESPEWKNQ